MFRLTGHDGPVTLGRDVDCEIFVPDVFVSRVHCRFEPIPDMPDGWAIVDARSTNGIWFRGRPVFRRILKKGDTIEIGSVAFQYDDLDLAPSLSSPTPYGAGSSVAALMDTIFTQGMRPSQFLRKAKKKPQWVRAAEQAEADRRAQEEAAAREAAEIAERLNFNDQTELDIEAQINEEAADLKPALVLVSAELVSRALGILEGGRPVDGMVGAGVEAGAYAELGAAGDAGSQLQTLLPDAAGGPGGLPGASAGEAPGRLPGGAINRADNLALVPANAMTAGQKKNLWEEAFGAASDAADADTKEGRKRKKEAEKAAKAAEKSAKAAAKKGGAAPAEPIVSTKRLFGEVISDFKERFANPASMEEIMDNIRDNPRRFAVAALITFLLVGGVVFYLNSGPKYKPPPRFLLNGKPNPAYQESADN